MDIARPEATVLTTYRVGLIYCYFRLTCNNSNVIFQWHRDGIRSHRFFCLRGNYSISIWLIQFQVRRALCLIRFSFFSHTRPSRSRFFLCWNALFRLIFIPSFRIRHFYFIKSLLAEMFEQTANFHSLKYSRLVIIDLH